MTSELSEDHPPGGSTERSPEPVKQETPSGRLTNGEWALFVASLNLDSGSLWENPLAQEYLGEAPNNLEAVKKMDAMLRAVRKWHRMQRKTSDGCQGK